MIYVDEPQRTNNNWCHMASKDSETLHIFAHKLGLRRSWYQDKPGFPHYDLSPAKRRAAIQLGATPVTNYKMVEIVRKWLLARDYFEQVYIFIKEVPCPTCDGYGTIDWASEGAKNPCPECLGTRSIEAETEMTEAQWDANF